MVFSGIFVEVDRMYKQAGIKLPTTRVLAVALQVYTRRAQKGRLEFSKYLVDYSQPRDTKGYPYKEITIDIDKVSRIKTATLVRNVDTWLEIKRTLATNN